MPSAGALTKIIRGKAAKAALEPAKTAPRELTPLGLFPTTTSGRIVNKTIEDGGYSVNLPTGTIPQSGLMMGKYGNADPRNMVIPVDEFSRAHVVQQEKANRGALSSPDAYFGAWKDNSGKVYLDVSRRFEPDQIRQATKYGERTGQLKGYDAGAKAEFPVGRWDEFLNSKEMRDRLLQMEEVGQQYRRNVMPGQEWWETPSIRGVYGEEKMPAINALIAATAPNNAPRPNTQLASEYMRRAISGEPLVQPEWRVPEGTMSRTPGVMLGSEQSRAPNLRRIEAGRPDLLQREKVADEAAALNGDPNLWPADRWYARAAEAPDRGVFTGPEEGTIPNAGGAYRKLTSAVNDHLNNAPNSRSLRDRTADVWVGLRETAKGNELFGQRMVGSAIPGPSVGYEQHFNDLVRDKAKFLNISEERLRRLLASGRETLLAKGGPVRVGALSR